MHFQNHVDGSPMFLGPETAMEIQAALGSDIAMLFDECPPHPCDAAYAAQSLELTLRWARRCRDWIDANQPQTAGQPQLHFGIVQGSAYPDLRERERARAGGDGLRRLRDRRRERGRAGAGDVSRPWRTACRSCRRTSRATRWGWARRRRCSRWSRAASTCSTACCPRGWRATARRSRWRHDQPEERALHPRLRGRSTEDTHPLCRGFSRAYMRHLFKAGEILGLRLISLHNLHFYLSLLSRARHAIEGGVFREFRAGVHRQLPDHTPNPQTHDSSDHPGAASALPAILAQAAPGATQPPAGPGGFSAIRWSSWC